MTSQLKMGRIGKKICATSKIRSLLKCLHNVFKRFDISLIPHSKSASFRIPVIKNSKALKLASPHANEREIVCKVGDPDYDPSICVKTKTYCKGLNKLLIDRCFETGVLELWGYDNQSIYDELTTEKILQRVNEKDIKRYVYLRKILSVILQGNFPYKENQKPD